MLKNCAAGAAFLIAAGSSFAQMTPVGAWHTIDDKTNEVKSEVQIGEVAGVLAGKVTKLLRKDVKQDVVCDECKDERKGKPILGLEILRGLKKTEGKDVWEGGTIIDPNDGVIYKVKLTPIEGGKKLEVRGFVGFALLGKTQTWVRVQ